MSDTQTEQTIQDLTITDLARAKILEVMEQEGLPAEDRNLRLFVAGGGCGGPAFGLAFDKVEEGDTAQKMGDLTVLVDPVSLPYVSGATVDFVDTAEVQGFKVTVPRPEGSCSPDSCGPEDQSGGCASSGCC